MAERSGILERFQLGLEGTAGVVALAGQYRELQAMKMTIMPEGNINMFSGQGYKVDLQSAIGKEWSSGQMEGYGCYNGLTYLYAGHIGGTALATASVYDWVFTPDSDAEDSGIKTFTIEQGQTARAHRALYGMVNTVDVEFTRAECKVSGDLFAQRISDGISMAASPPVLAAAPPLAGHAPL